MKTLCVYHSIDLDGWMSAAIVEKWFIKENEFWNITNLNSENEFKTKTNRGLIGVVNPTIDFIGYNYGQPIPDLSEYDKVIMVDISFPAEKMYDLWSILGTNFIWLDHHISAIKDVDEKLPLQKIIGIRDTKFAACELTWKYFFLNSSMPEIVRLLGRWDCFGHKGTDEEQKVLEFQYGARACINNYEDAYMYLDRSLTEDNKMNDRIVEVMWTNGRGIYNFLCMDAKQSYKNGFEIKLFEPNCKLAIDGILNFICINKERFNPINFGIDYHSDGYDGVACFHYANGEYNFSLYNDNGEVDCSVIAKQFGGGGHKGASGFRVKSLDQIINQ